MYNPSVASSTSQALHLRHMASHPCLKESSEVEYLENDNLYLINLGITSYYLVKNRHFFYRREKYQHFWCQLGPRGWLHQSYILQYLNMGMCLCEQGTSTQHRRVLSSLIRLQSSRSKSLIVSTKWAESISLPTQRGQSPYC